MCSISELATELDGLDDAALVDVVAEGLRRRGSADSATGGSEALLGLVEEALRRVAADPLAGLSDGALADSLERLHRLETVVHAEKLRRVGEVEARQAWRGQGCRSTADLLAQRLRLTRGEAKAQAGTAAALRQLPQTREKLACGELGVGQAQVAARALEETPAQARQQLDRLVAQEGPEVDRRGLCERVSVWQHSVDPTILEDREAAAWRRRWLRTAPDPADGTVRVEGRLDPLGGGKLIAALDALSRPDGHADGRSFWQRRADALVELAQAALDAGGLPEVAAQRPHLLMIASAETLAGSPHAPVALLDAYGPLSAASAGLVACDAETTTVTVDRNGAVLDAGRSRREPTSRQRAAVIARDRRCVGCGASATRCQIHHIRHIRHWAHGGASDEPNLCLLCWDCHHKVHHCGWTVVRGPGGGFAARAPGFDAQPRPG